MSNDVARTVLEVTGLQVAFNTASGPVPAVRGVDLTVRSGETVALVGESGSGKSTSVLGMLGLVPRSALVTAEALCFEGQSSLDPRSRPLLRNQLGRGIGVVFQDPQSSLNPTMRVGAQIGETLSVHQRLSKAESRQRVLAALDEVAVPDPERCFKAYPHELSGGMRQRVMIAMATIMKPSLLIADEPTTALDVTIQAQIVDLLLDLQRTHGTAIVFITHDLSLVSGFADRTMVMYAGQVVEHNRTDEVVDKPRHPYTRALIASVPTLDSVDLQPISGRPPNPRALPEGCAFAPRCPLAHDACEAPPALATRPTDGLTDGLTEEPLGIPAVRCWLGPEVDEAPHQEEALDRV